MNHPEIRSTQSHKNMAFQLDQAILFYKSPDHKAFATIHDVRLEDGTPQIGAGVPLTRPKLRKWVKTLQEDRKLEILPENMIAQNNDSIIWWIPESRREALFDIKERPNVSYKSFGKGKISATVPYPAMLFVLTSNSMKIFALKENVRPTLQTKLWLAPILNLYSNGSLCWGNIHRPSPADKNCQEICESAIFESWNTHENAQNNILYKGGLEKFWDALVTKTPNRFPITRLAPVTKIETNGKRIRILEPADKKQATLQDLILSCNQD